MMAKLKNPLLKLVNYWSIHPRFVSSMAKKYNNQELSRYWNSADLAMIHGMSRVVRIIIFYFVLIIF